MKKDDYYKLIIAILVSQCAGFLGALFTTPSIQGWYMLLNKPALNPPNWIFGPVWTILYILIGISAFLIWREGIKKENIKKALSVFLFQLLLNSLWSILFFGLHNPALAMIDIIVLWLSILCTILCFREISRFSAYLLYPYIIWVSFASYLNLSIWWLN